MMQNVADYLTWIYLALVAIVTVLGLVWALRTSSYRKVKPVSQIIAGLLSFVAILGVLQITGLALNTVYAAIAVVLGLVLGWLLGRGGRIVSFEGDRLVKPSAVPGWVSAIGWILVAASIAFLGPNSVSASLLVPLLGASMDLAQTITYSLRARGVAGETGPAVA